MTRIPVKKVPLPCDKQLWSPSVLPGQIVIVSTVDRKGHPNLAPKSWITMTAFAGPRLEAGAPWTIAPWRRTS